VSGINDLRSAAIKSLQKQKARQKVANRLEKVSMRTGKQRIQLQHQFQQPNNMNSMNRMNGSNSSYYNINNGNNNLSSFSMGGATNRRQSSIFGTLDPSVMDEIVSGCFDEDED